jgi:hypothetical protein
MPRALSRAQTSALSHQLVRLLFYAPFILPHQRASLGKVCLLQQTVVDVDLTYWYRIVPMRSYVKGWKISPSHYLNQDLANIWLDK